MQVSRSRSPCTSSAATAESTPPERPQMARRFAPTSARSGDLLLDEVSGSNPARSGRCGTGSCGGFPCPALCAHLGWNTTPNNKAGSRAASPPRARWHSPPSPGSRGRRGDLVTVARTDTVIVHRSQTGNSPAFSRWQSRRDHIRGSLEGVPHLLTGAPGAASVADPENGGAQFEGLGSAVGAPASTPSWARQRTPCLSGRIAL